MRPACSPVGGRPLRVMYFGFPVLSHVAPSLALVRALRRRGAQVEYHATSRFRGVVQGAGARFVPYPDGCEGFDTAMGLAAFLERVLALSERVLPALTAAASPGDIVISDASALWGRLFARAAGMPLVAAVSTFALNRSMVQLVAPSVAAAPSGAGLDRLNHHHGAGLEDAVDVLVPDADLTVVFTSRGFQPGGAFFDRRHLFVGPRLEARPRPGPRVEPLDARPLAYLSLGTIFNRDLATLRLAAQALTDAGWQVVVSLGDAARTPTGAWPPGVRVYPFVDQLGTLARADLAVTHGGMGTVSEALSFGVPLIVAPQGLDQFLVARRAAHLGAALVVESNRPAAWSRAVASMVGDRARFAHAAARIGRGFADATPLSHAIDEVFGLVAAQHESRSASSP